MCKGRVNHSACAKSAVFSPVIVRVVEMPVGSVDGGCPAPDKAVGEAVEQHWTASDKPG